MVIFRAILNTPSVPEALLNTVAAFLAVPGTFRGVPERLSVLEQMFWNAWNTRSRYVPGTFQTFQIHSKNVPNLPGIYQKR